MKKSQKMSFQHFDQKFSIFFNNFFFKPYLRIENVSENAKSAKSIPGAQRKFRLKIIDFWRFSDFLMIFGNFGFPWPGRGTFPELSWNPRPQKKFLVEIHILNFSEPKKLLESVQGARRTIRLKIIEFSRKCTSFLKFLYHWC